MEPDIAIPRSFIDSPRWWTDGSRWLTDLPRIACEQCGPWGLTVTGRPFWDGGGTVHLIDADAEAGAMLLERLDANGSLLTVPSREAMVVLGVTLPRLAVPADLHSVQVLRGSREPWLTVDPVLMRGEHHRPLRHGGGRRRHRPRPRPELGAVPHRGLLTVGTRCRPHGGPGTLPASRVRLRRVNTATAHRPRLSARRRRCRPR